MIMGLMNTGPLITKFLCVGGVVNDRSETSRAPIFESYPCQRATRAGEVREFLQRPLDSISLALPTNPDSVCAREQLLPTFTLLFRCLSPIRRVKGERQIRKRQSDVSVKERESEAESPRHIEPVNCS